MNILSILYQGQIKCHNWPEITELLLHGWSEVLHALLFHLQTEKCCAQKNLYWRETVFNSIFKSLFQSQLRKAVTFGCLCDQAFSTWPVRHTEDQDLNQRFAFNEVPPWVIRGCSTYTYVVTWGRGISSTTELRYRLSGGWDHHHYTQTAMTWTLKQTGG